MKEKMVASHLAVSLLVGLLVGMLLTILIAGIGASLIASEKVPENTADWIVVLAVLCGSMASSLVVTAREQGTRILMCLAGGAIYFVGLLCAGAVLFDGVSGGVGLTGLVAVCGSVVMWMLGMKSGKKQKIKVPKMRF